MSAVASIILAAGQGKRMKSTLPKVLHPVAGIPMVSYSLELTGSLNLAKRIVVLGHQFERIKEAILSVDRKVLFVHQKEQLGTAHAVQAAEPYLTDFSGIILIISADVPLLKASTIQKIITHHQRAANSGTLLTARVKHPEGYGRIIRNAAGEVIQIVEEGDTLPEQRKVNEINSGIYCFNSKELFQALAQVKKDNSQKEYYLTDVIRILLEKGSSIGSITVDDPVEITGINDQQTLSQVSQLIYERNALAHMEEGVIVISPGNTFLEQRVQIGPGTIIYPFTVITAGSQIGSGCQIGPYTHIVESKIGSQTRIFSSLVEKSRIGSNSDIGPFAHIRPESIICDEVKIGNFVEIKKTLVGEGTRVGHLTYLGDAVLGKQVNIGAGTITCNYDGVRKNRTTIEDGVFIGSNNALVAPVIIGKDSYTAAGSTITGNVPAQSLGIARAKQENITGWVSKKRSRTKIKK